MEIITTGGEIMSGLTVDTNFSWAADRLAGAGLPVSYHTSVGDDVGEIVLALRVAAARAQAVVVSGGLGPTADDLGREAAASFLGVGLVEDAEARGWVEQYLRGRGRRVDRVHARLWSVPAGARALRNRRGSAPGFEVEREGVVYYFLPGVPSEFRDMVEAYVVPGLKQRFPTREAVLSMLVKVTGLRESEVAEQIEGAPVEGVEVGFRAHFPEVHLRLTAHGATEGEARCRLERAVALVAERLGESVFSTDGRTLEEVVVGMLLERRLTISVAESCTGGLLGHRITNVPGSSGCFERGVVSYSNEAKVELLGVPAELIAAHGAVSAPVAEAMASGIRSVAGTDIGVGITGIAGPGGGTPAKPVGTVHIALSHRRKGVFSRRFLFGGDRLQIKTASTQAALDMVRRFVLNGV